MQRRELLKGLAAATGVTLAANGLDPARATPPQKGPAAMGKPVDLFTKDWGSGAPLLFLHSWAVTNEIFQYQHAHFVEAGHRVVAYDRRGHGRSAQPVDGYDADTLADDLSRVIKQHDLTGVTLIAHSMAGGEVVRYLTRHGASKVARIVLLAPTTPFLAKAPDNPDGLDLAGAARLRALWAKDFPGWMRANAAPFFMPDTSQGMIDWCLNMIAQIPVRVAMECNRHMVETDFRPDCRAVTVPTLIIQGAKDASAPIALTGQRTAALIPHAKFITYDDAPHGLMLTHAERLNGDIAAFLASNI